MKRLLIVLACFSLSACGDKNVGFPLHNAIYKNDVAAVKALVDSGADVNAVDTWGHFPLVAATDKSLEITRYLVEHGADINARDDNDETVLRRATLSCDLNMTRYLVEQGADINPIVTDYYVLYDASQCRESGVFQYLLTLDGIDLNKGGKTIYREAIASRNMELVVLLRKAGLTERFSKEDEGLSFDDALRTPSFYRPPPGDYEVSDDNREMYALAVEDCNYLLTPNKTGLTIATGGVGYVIGLGIDKARIPHIFPKCMEAMGFKKSE